MDNIINFKELIYPKNHTEDIPLMMEAYNEALKAYENGEVPIGAVIVYEGQVVGRGFNKIELQQDATAHAESLAIADASEIMGSWRLNETTLYVTLEPCMMCLGASLQSRVGRIVYGATDSRFGAISTHSYREGAVDSYQRFPEIKGGVMLEECQGLIRDFFKEVRKKAKEKQRQSDKYNGK